MGIFFYHSFILWKVKLRIVEVDGKLEEFEDALEFAGVQGNEEVEEVKGKEEGFGVALRIYSLAFDLFHGLGDGLAFDLVHDGVL